MSGVRRLKIGHGLDRDRRTWDDGEQVRQPGLHLGDVLAKYLDDFRRGCRLVFRIALEGLAEGREIRETLLVRNGQHVGLNAIDLFQSDLVNLRGGQAADRGAAADVVQIACVAAGQ
jgi:hypothetical protein